MGFIVGSFPFLEFLCEVLHAVKIEEAEGDRRCWPEEVHRWRGMGSGAPGGPCASMGQLGSARGGPRWPGYGSSGPTAGEDGLGVGRPWPAGAGSGGEHQGVQAAALLGR